MAFLYSTENLINSTTLPADTAAYRSTEDAIYQVENLYNQRPSKPFRFTAKAGQWVKVNLGSRQLISLFAIFNHNLQDSATMQLHCSGNNIVYRLISNLTWRQHDLYKKCGVTDQWFRFSVSDATNPDSLELGEMWLGNWTEFSNAKTQSPRADGPQFWTVEHQTPYGQDHDAFLSENDRFHIALRNVNDINAADEIQTFLSAVFQANNRFLMIPDDKTPHVYYCKIENKSDFADRIIYGDANELRDWRISVKSLTRGIALL